MTRKSLLGIAIFFLLLVGSAAILDQNVMLASGANPSKLQIYIGPNNLPADNNAYDCIAVQLQDSKGSPARATQDITVSLSSSLTNIGDVVFSTITIPKGSTYETDQFQTTFSPGVTSITAAASGFAAVQASITTVGPIPASLVVYGFPATLPADGNSYEGAVIVQLQDSSGAPAKAPIEGVQVTLSSSNTAVGTVDDSVSIQGGQTFATATFTTTLTAGTASVTAVASGFTSKQATFTTQNGTTVPANLKIFLGPPKVPADAVTYRQVAVLLLDSSSKVAKAPQDITVTLASSVETVGTIEQTITIPQGASFATANFDSTYKSGTTTITATATDLKTTQETLTTVGNTPTKLGVYTVPASLPADYQTFQAIQVQLQDSSGKPAKDPNGDITVSLFSSTADAGDVATQELTIPFGQTSAKGKFTTTYTANSTTITAQVSNYATGTAKITTYLIDQFSLKVSLVPDLNPIAPGKNTTVRAYVTYEGKQPASGVKITFNSTKGGNFTTPAYEGNGTYTTVFTAPKTQAVCNITANVTKTSYLSSIGSTNITSSNLAVDPASLGTIIILVTQNSGSKPIAGATVLSTVAPGGALLTSITNNTGYAKFTNATPGSYTFQITKSGYATQTQTDNLQAGKTTSNTVKLAVPSNPWPMIIIIIVVVIVVAVVAAFMLMRRRKQKRFAKKPVKSNELQFTLP